jgi:hypothetical protein
MVVRVGDKAVSITSAPRVDTARMQGNALDLTLSYFPGETAYTVLMPVAEPVQVELDGAELPRRPGPIDTPQGWSYQPDLGCLTLKVKYTNGPRNARLVGLSVITPDAPKPEWEFAAAGDACGWMPARGVKPLGVKDGLLTVDVNGPDPYIISPAVSLDTTRVTGITLRARATAPDGQMFFSISGKGYGPTQYRQFKLPADGQFHEVKVDLRVEPLWTGVVDQIRFDFADAPCQVQVDWVRLVTAKG